MLTESRVGSVVLAAARARHRALQVRGHRERPRARILQRGPTMGDDACVRRLLPQGSRRPRFSRPERAIHARASSISVRGRRTRTPSPERKWLMLCVRTRSRSLRRGSGRLSHPQARGPGRGRSLSGDGSGLKPRGGTLRRAGRFRELRGQVPPDLRHGGLREHETKETKLAKDQDRVAQSSRAGPPRSFKDSFRA